jgi:hypothetical protein
MRHRQSAVREVEKPKTSAAYPGPW